MNNQEFKRIKILPDIMSCEELKDEFRKIVSETKITNKLKDKELLLLAYSELSERQWNTYQILEIDILTEIDSILIKLWDKTSLDNTEIIIGIIARLGLEETFTEIKNNLSNKSTKDVNHEISSLEKIILRILRFFNQY